MARYCFYCGCELASGEKCKCRLNKNQSDTPEPNTDSRDKENTSSHAGFRHRASTAKDQISALFPLILQGLLYTGHYFTRPATKIRQESIRLHRHSAIPSIISICCMSGFVCTAMLTEGSSTFLIFISSVGLRTTPFRHHPLFSFFFFSTLIAIWFFIVCISFFIASVIIGKKLKFRRLLDLITIPSIYILAMEILILCTIPFGGSGSLTFFISAIIFLFLGNHTAFRNALSLQDDQAIFFVVFPYLFSTIIFRLLFNEIAPRIVLPV